MAEYQKKKKKIYPWACPEPCTCLRLEILEVSKPEVSLVLPQPKAGDAKKGLYVFLAYPFPGPKVQRPLTPGLTSLSSPSLPPSTKPPLTPRQWLPLPPLALCCPGAGPTPSLGPLLPRSWLFFFFSPSAPYCIYLSCKTHFLWSMNLILQN